MPLNPRTVLKTSSDWDDWHFMIWKKAGKNGLWDYIDPDCEDNPVLAAPMEPQLAAPSTAPSLAPGIASVTYNALGTEHDAGTETTLATSDGTESDNPEIELYRTELRKFRSQKKAMARLSTFVCSSLDPENKQLVQNVPSLTEKLKILKKHVAPSRFVRQRDARDRFERLHLAGKTLEEFDAFGDEIRYTFRLFTSLRMTLMEILPLHDFLDSVRDLVPEFVTVWEHRLTTMPDSEELPKFCELAKNFKDYCITFHPEVWYGETLKTSSKAMTIATKTAKQPETGAKRIINPCFCGGMHRYRDCYYIVESKRPAKWTPNSGTEQKFDDLMRRSKKFRGHVERARKGAGTSYETDSDVLPVSV